MSLNATGLFLRRGSASKVANLSQRFSWFEFVVMAKRFVDPVDQKKKIIGINLISNKLMLF